MKYDWKMDLYWKSPVILQNWGVSLYAIYLDRLYHGEEYQKYLGLFAERESWNWEKMQHWQFDMLKRVLEDAVIHCEYYRNALKDIPLDKISSPSDLKLLPLLHKQQVRENEHLFIDDRYDPKKMFKDKTSGSTGTSLNIYWTIPCIQRMWASFEVRVRNAAGVSQHQPRAMLGGRPVTKGDTRKPPYWRYNSHWKQLYLSSYHISYATAPLYVDAIRKYGSVWITGYGSAIANLASSALEQGLEPVPMKAAVVSGDTLQPGMRSVIEEFFQCKCYDSYGLVEGVTMAMECEPERLQLNPDLGIVEILREDGSACEPGEVGEIVATGIMNSAMPLIRYRTGDYAAWDTVQEPFGGRDLPIITSLEGRVDDYLIAEDGRRIGRLSTAVKRSPSIHSMQIVQKRNGHAYLLVRPGENYRNGDAIPVRDDILERIGEFHVEIVEVQDIPRTPKGKQKLVVRLDDQPGMKDLYSFLK